MSSAASKASRAMNSSKRNRPSLAMSKSQRSEAATSDTTTSHSTPLFMDDVSSQYASLSERLALENAATSANNTTSSTANTAATTTGKKQKVRWAETAALASTFDSANAQDTNRARNSPLETIADLFSRKYTAPVFLVVACSIFLMVHLSGGNHELYGNKGTTPSHHGDAAETSDPLALTPSSDDTSSFSSLQKSRSYNFGQGDGFSSLIFSFVPTPSPSNDETPIPTAEVITHITPMVRSFPSSTSEQKSGFEPGWVLVPTSSNGKGGDYNGGDIDFKEGWGYPPGVPTPDPALLNGVYYNGGYYNEAGQFHGGINGIGMNGPLNVELAPDKWGIPPGQPTPDPALLSQVSPQTQKWNFPDGYPTPDPAFMPKAPSTTELGKGKPGSVAGGTWGYPPGVPTPNPDLAVEVAPPSGENVTPDDDGSQEDLSLTDKDAPDYYDGSQVGLSWQYPPGVPTPDPALLAGVPDTITWGYPPGVPTPDPALLEGNAVSMVWGYPPGVPTPDPGLLLGETISPTLRQVETGDSDPDITFKMPDILPLAPPPPPDTLPPIGPKDSNGNVIEVASPIPAPKIPITVKNPGFPPPPTPEVNTQPYSGGWFRPLDSSPRPPRPGPRPDRPGRAPAFLGLGQQQQGGYIMGGCGGCCGGCCGCGGMMMGGMGAGQAVDGSSFVVPQFTAGTDVRFNLPGGISVSGVAEPACPWECVIDETVPTKGRSNEDDAIYEIFYTNPLNCCGTIVEIGAGNGEDNSPSYFFEHGMNWTAILTEADPISFDIMTKKRTGDKAAVLNGAFCQEGPHIYFDEDSRLFQTVTPDQYSSEAMSSSFAVNETTTKIECIRLDSDILTGLDHVNVMIIRVKGDPWSVVRTMDWDVKVDIWVILMEEKPGMLHDTLRAALKLHDYVPAAWEIKLWCESPMNCMQNEVWLRKSFSALPNPLLGESPGLRGSLIG